MMVCDSLADLNGGHRAHRFRRSRPPAIPYADARTLARHAELVVWERDPERLRRFAEEFPQARVVDSLARALDSGPDGVVLTVPNPQVPEALGEVLKTGVACFVNKPAAATREQLARLDRLPIHERVMSASVLRFAPAFAGVRVDPGDVLSVRATVRHDVGLWATGYNAWQDTPAEGGGTMVTMGVHGVELLVALLGPEVRLVGAARATRHYDTLRSEDTGVLALQWGSGITGVVEIVGVSDGESYGVTVHRRGGVGAHRDRGRRRSGAGARLRRDDRGVPADGGRRAEPGALAADPGHPRRPRPRARRLEPPRARRLEPPRARRSHPSPSPRETA